MAAAAFAGLVAEVEAAARSGTPERRVRMLQQLADLFLADARRLQPEHVRVFDDVFVRLIERIDARALARISTILAAFEPAPAETIRRLARHEDETVAAPLLAQASCLSDDDLVQIACSRSQQHLLAIARRASLGEDITSLVLKRAGKETARALVKNPGARFSEKAYAALLAVAERDETVAEAAGLRADLPKPLLRDLLTNTTDTVRARLLKAAPISQRDRIKSAIEDLAAEAAQPPTNLPTDYSNVLAMVEELNRTGKLNDSTVNRFAMRREHANVIAALSVLSGATVEVIGPLMEDARCEGLIIACRASRLNWQTTLSVLNNRRAPKPAKEQLEMGKEMFEMLYLSSAQYTIRFEPPMPASARLAMEARR
jgi:uncharacterized protein (DUF2336 family)